MSGRLVFDAALSRSKLEAIASFGLWAPVGAGHARDAFHEHGPLLQVFVQI